ncbi:DUF7528 family protein [Natronosalvus halobius]|uniref:DUF7528 family protein n=1 Tax=Natronosalvus halobius TaxID=2953746 RepID=UPI0020A160F3|nr:hypothetical protein [Natronosalvus halobius]USZ73094.1 hypothetical protein NGM15_07270 [Natronosalvus halobius]
MTDRREYVHTVGTRREDGSYVVSRRSADSTGNQQVFDSFEALESLYADLPNRFDADAVGCQGTKITGSRRHMLIRHFVEHPAFDCRLVSRRPLEVVKR